MERDYTEQLTVYNDNLDLYIHEFFRNRCYPDELTEDYISRASQSVWNACLMYLRKNVTSTLDLKQGNIYSIDNPNIYSNKTIDTNYNAYNYDLLLCIVDIYIYYCSLYDKEISFVGFSLLTGITDRIINEWGNSERVNPTSFLIWQKLRHYREESLSAKLATGNKNPVGILAILNRHYQWNNATIAITQNDGGSASAAAIAEKYKAATLPKKPIIDE
jgi:hypothetical protein